MKHESTTVKCSGRLYEKTFETICVKGKGLSIASSAAQEVTSQEQAKQSQEGTPGD